MNKGRPKGIFTTTILALKIGEHTVIRYAGDFVPTNAIYPRVSRISKSTGRSFECKRLTETTFEVRRIA